MADIKELFGRRLRELRTERNLILEQLSNLIDIDVRNIIKIETGQTFPRIKNIEKILQVFDMTFSDFLRFEHLDNIENLKQKIIDKMNTDDEIVRYIYKILF